MIAASGLLSDVLASQGFATFLRVESWLGSTLLADDIPVTAGTLEADVALRTGTRVTLAVPVEENGTSWVPFKDDSPLACWGQRFRISYGVEVDHDQVEWINLGWFLVYSADTQGDSINVELLGLLALVDEATLATEYQPKAGAQFGDIIRALVEPGITVNDDAAPTDRVPGVTTVTYSDNRLDSVLAADDAWPAQAVVDPDGFLDITPVPGPPMADDAVLSLTDAEGGTVINPVASISRDGAFNAVVVKGAYPDSDPTKAGQEIVATAYDTDPTSPFRLGGTFSPYVVPFEYSSPLLTTPAMAMAAAKSILARKRRTATRTVQVDCVPNPLLQTGDVVLVTSRRLGLSNAVGEVSALSLPLLADGGVMSLTVVLGVTF